MYSRIQQSEMTARIRALHESNGLTGWQTDVISRDGLFEYVNNSQQGRYESMGTFPIDVDEDKIRNSCPSPFSWEEVGGPLIGHARNTPVFDAYVSMEAERVSGDCYLWWDGDLFSDDSETSCIQFAPEDWCATRMAITLNHPWWLSFDDDKLVFSPDGLDVLVAFHHECFELATLRHEVSIESLWKNICERITTT
jgi:hypothetical protein